MSVQKEQKEISVIFESILNNITSKLQYQGNQFYLLCKKQKSGPHCQLFLTDFSQNFWIKKITYQYLLQLKQKLKIKTDLKLFTQHLANGLKQNCVIKNLTQHPIIVINLRVSEGLVINCTIQVKDYHANVQKNQKNFSKLLKLYGSQLYQAKQTIQKQTISKIQSIKQEIQMKNRVQKGKQGSKTLQNKIFGRPQNPVAEKNRDLINPFRKKRKGQGMKLIKVSDKQDQSSSN